MITNRHDDGNASRELATDFRSAITLHLEPAQQHGGRCYPNHLQITVSNWDKDYRGAQ
jgi:hypothetical protein